MTKAILVFGGAIVMAAASVAALAPASAQASSLSTLGHSTSLNQTTRAAFFATMYRHFGEHTPTNTCVSRGVSAWASESGLPYPERTYSAGEISSILGIDVGVSKRTRWNVTAISAAARQGINGYHWISASEALPGDWLVWPGYEHISVLVDKPGGFFRSVGAAGPLTRVSYQPQNGGKPASYFEGAIRPPYR